MTPMEGRASFSWNTPRRKANALVGIVLSLCYYLLCCNCGQSILRGLVVHVEVLAQVMLPNGPPKRVTHSWQQKQQPTNLLYKQ